MSSEATSPIAVIGMACRYPGAENLLQLWENILTRRQQFREIPDVRLPLSEYYDEDPATQDKTYGKKAAVLDGFEFDAGSYRIPKTTFETTDIVHWLALSTALEAVRHAGLSGDGLLREKAGVILGNTLTGEETRANTLRQRWPFVRKMLRRAAAAHSLAAEDFQAFETTVEQLYKSVFPPTTEDTLAGGLANTIAGRICNYLDLHGGGYIVDGACSSSLLAIATAADYLCQGRMDLVIAGGVDVSLDTFELIGFSKATALSKDEMRVYDRRGKGFIPGEGCGMVVLKRLEDARRDGDAVYALLHGWGVSSDGRGGITAPSAAGQARALVRAYRAAGYAPQTLAFIEGHGTGTAVGDRIELEGIAGALQTFGSAEDHCVGVTSFKSIVGHTKAAAGIGGFIKTVIALNRRIVPPTAGCAEPHASFADVARPLYPVLEGRICSAQESLRAGVSAMGFGGINCHVTLESGDGPADRLAPQLSEESLLASWQHTEVIAFAAPDEASLIEQIEQAREEVRGLASGELIDFAAHRAQRLQAHPWRAAVLARSVDELVARLETLAGRLRSFSLEVGQLWRGEQIWAGNAVKAGKVGFIFPGQGSQQIGMGKSLVQRFAWADDFVAKMDTEVETSRRDSGCTDAGEPLSRMFLRRGQPDPAGTREPAWLAQLTRTENAQPGICAVSWMWARRLEELGIIPQAAGGHSLGELTALAVAGGYDAQTLVRLAAIRGIAMASPDGANGRMAALACDAGTAASLLEHAGGYCVIANANSPQQTVISGESEAVLRVVEAAVGKGFRAQVLQVSNGFHSRLVEPAAECLRRDGRVPEKIQPLRLRVISGIEGREITEDLALRDYLSRQIVSKVDFTKLLERLSEHCDWFIEVGPGRVLSGLVQAHDPSLVRRCMPVESRPGRDADLNAVMAEAFVRGLALRWDRLYEGRLLRPFVPAAERKFYVNPCEREPLPVTVSRRDYPLWRSPNPLLAAKPDDAASLRIVEPAEIAPAGGSVRKVLIDLICERTGFAAESISDDARLLDDLNLDSIKIGTLLADAAIRLGVAGKIDTMALGGATVGAVITALDAAARPAGGQREAWDLLLELICERTGFDRDCLNGEMRLLDDLNIDSIKAASLLGDLLLQTGTQNKLEAGRLANAALAEIAQQVQAAMEGGPGREGPDAPAASACARWVRAFTLSRVCEPDNGLQQTGGPAPRLLLIAPGDESRGAALAEALDVPLFDSVPTAQVLSDTLVLILGNGGVTAVDQLALLHRVASEQPEVWRQIRTVVCVQSQAQTWEDGTPGTTAWSFFASLSLERPELEVLVLDFHPALSEVFIQARMRMEITGQAGYRAVEYDADGQRWRRCMDVIEPEDCSPRSLAWSTDDVLLVTGGGKGITAECALAFARETGVKLALVGRSGAPAAGDKGELAENLRRLANAGVEYRYYAADVADRAAMAEIIARVREDLGAVTAVLHGAGGNTPRRLVEVSAEQARQEIAPKLQGAENLLALLDGAPLKLFAAFTSIIGVTGMHNNAWYAYSNETVARLLEGYAARHPHAAVVSYAFGVWDSVGMGVKLGSVRHLEQMGIDAIPVEEGVRHFMRWTRSAPPGREVIVTASSRGLATWDRPKGVNWMQTLRFAGQPQRFEPGIEKITRVTLSADEDLYLCDHDFRGSLLMPTVMGLEAMAQCCLSIAGARFEITRIEDIRLERPIVVNRDWPAVIEIRALALERTGMDDDRIIETSIHAEQTGWEPAHFAARFVLGQRRAAQDAPQPPASSRPLAIDPRQELYGGVLFQGPLFQRISAIESLDESHVVFATEARTETLAAPEGFAEQVRAPLVLGDPYYRDTLLQAAQLSLTPEICLPIRIDSIDLYASRTPAGRYRAEAKVLGRRDRRVLGEVTVYDEEGRLIEHIRGYEVQVLERRADLPTPAELMRERQFPEQAVLQQALAAAACSEGLAAPHCVLRRMPDIHRQRRADRRAAALPVMRAALRGAAWRSGFAPENAEVRWLDSGKPVVSTGMAQIDDSGMGISLSHEGDLLLCVAGEGPQGCDLVGPIRRSPRQWRAMLGQRLFELLKRLEGAGVTLDHAGATVWAAWEAGIKALDGRDIALELISRQDSHCTFMASRAASRVKVMTVSAPLGEGREFAVAVVMGETRAEPPGAENARQRSDAGIIPAACPDSWSGWLSAGGNTADFFGLKAELQAGAAEPRVSFRFPLAFKDGANPDGTVYFGRFFEWMGRLREMALQPVLGQLADEFASGKWAWVTNRSWLKIEKPVRAGEIVEVSCRFLGRGGPDDATVSVGFEWHRVLAGGALEKLATSQIQMTWAKVVAHGVVSPDAYPPYLDRFFRELTVAGEQGESGDAGSYRHAKELIGAGLWRKKQGPGPGVLLAEHSCGTTLNDANLVGNIYYSKYYELLGVLRDSHFFRVVPDAYRMAGNRAGIRCLYTEVSHLRDAMPFDTLSTRMYIHSVYEKGFELGFEFFRVLPDGQAEKLATGVHVIGWMAAGEEARPLELPDALSSHLLSRIPGYAATVIEEDAA